jgi:hypothetical protein
MQAMLRIPELAMFGESRLRRFVYEFCHFEEVLDSDDDEREVDSETKQDRARA